MRCRQREIQVNHLLELNILEAIILPIEEKNMESAVKAMVQPLLEEDFVTEEYLQSVLERGDVFHKFKPHCPATWKSGNGSEYKTCHWKNESSDFVG